MEKPIRQFIKGSFIICLVYMAGYLIAPIEVRYISSLTSNPTLIGATYAIGALFFALLSVWLGRQSDRFGRNRFIVLGCVLGIVYPLLYASTYNVFQYMGVKFIWAFSAVATSPIFMAYLQDILKHIKNKGHYIGMLYAVQSILGALSHLIGGYLSDRFGLSAPYFAMSIIFLLATVIAIREIGLKPTSKPKTTEKKRSILFGLRYILKKPELKFYFVQNTAFNINWGIKIMLWPLIIFSMAQSDIITGSIFATMGIAAFFILLFSGKLVDRLGPFIPAQISMFILGLSGIFLAFTGNIYIFWLFAAIYAIGEAIHGPAQGVILTEHIESKYRGELLGLDAVFDNIFAMISPFAAGLLLNFWEPQSILLIYISLFWISLAICHIIYKTRINN
ncbi:MAG: MFS transporter [Candidatus Aenigmarchaeota archaeon]|nr:MFS transporter [Candidatus Aenigmarchaeota archaeon]